VVVSPSEATGHLPSSVCGPPRYGVASISGDISSQFVTALMLIGPYLPGGLRLELTSPLVSRPYVELTASVMAWFGVDGVVFGHDQIEVPAGRYEPRTIDVEPDASSASYPLAIAAIVGGSVEIEGLGTSALQGDVRFADLLTEMGCNVRRTSSSVTLTRRLDIPLRGIDVDMAEISDLVPTLAVVACHATTTTRIRGVGFIRAKESDRIGDLADELRGTGADVEPTSDGLIVRPSGPDLHGSAMSTHHDHRLAMAFAVLGAHTTGIVVDDPGVVSKSWPGFWSMYESLGEIRR